MFSCFRVGCAWNAIVYRWAGINGHLLVLEYALANGCDGDFPTLGLICASGQVGAVKLLHEGGLPLPDYALSFATDAGELAMVKYLVEHPKSCVVPECRARWEGPEPKRNRCTLEHSFRSLAQIDHKSMRFAFERFDAPLLEYFHKAGGRWETNMLIALLDPAAVIKQKRRWKTDEDKLEAKLACFRVFTEHDMELPCRVNISSSIWRLFWDRCLTQFDGCEFVDCKACVVFDREESYCRPYVEYMARAKNLTMDSDAVCT